MEIFLCSEPTWKALNTCNLHSEERHVIFETFSSALLQLGCAKEGKGRACDEIRNTLIVVIHWLCVAQHWCYMFIELTGGWCSWWPAGACLSTKRSAVWLSNRLSDCKSDLCCHEALTAWRCGKGSFLRQDRLLSRISDTFRDRPATKIGYTALLSRWNLPWFCFRFTVGSTFTRNMVVWILGKERWYKFI